MRSKLISYAFWAFVLAQGCGALSATAIGLLGFPWRRSVGDALFLEGAVLLIVGGLIDMSHSITFSRIRALRRSKVSDPPPPIHTPRRNYILLIAGTLLCLQGALLAYLFPLSRG